MTIHKNSPQDNGYKEKRRKDIERKLDDKIKQEERSTNNPNQIAM